MIAPTLSLLTLAAAPPQAAADEVRTYDVSGLGTRFTDLEGDHAWESLVPLFDAHEPGDLSADDGGASSDSSELVELLRDVLAEEFQYEGRSLQVGDDQIVVTGPAELHARVERLIGFLEGAAQSDVPLRVEVLQLAGGAAPRLGGAVIDASELDALAGGARRQTFDLALRGDVPGRVRSTRFASVVVDYDVEIATNSAIHEPKVLQTEIGTRVVAMGAPAPGGVNVALLVKRGDVEPRRRERGIAMSMVFVGQDGIRRAADPALFAEDTRFTGHAMATTAFLPDGKALVFASSTPDGGTEIVALRSAGGETQDAYALDLGQGGRRLVLASVGAVAAPSYAFTGEVFSGRGTMDFSLRGHTLSYAAPDGLFNTLLVGGDAAAFQQTASRVAGGLVRVRSTGPWMAVFDARIGESADRDAAGDAFETVRGLLASAPPAPTLTARLTLEGPSGSASAVAPVRSGAGLGVAVGGQHFEVTNYYVELAEKASATDIEVRSVFDGMMVWLRPVVLADGRLALDVAGGANATTAQDQAPLEDDLVSYLDRVQGRRLMLSGRRTLRPDERGGWRTVYGAEGMRLTVELTR